MGYDECVAAYSNKEDAEKNNTDYIIDEVTLNKYVNKEYWYIVIRKDNGALFKETQGYKLVDKDWDYEIPTNNQLIDNPNIWTRSYISRKHAIELAQQVRHNYEQYQTRT